jgi:hypothetical protein
MIPIPAESALYCPANAKALLLSGCAPRRSPPQAVLVVGREVGDGNSHLLLALAHATWLGQAVAHCSLRWVTIAPSINRCTRCANLRISRHYFPFELGEVLRSVCSISQLDMAKGARRSVSLQPPHIKRQGESQGPPLRNYPVERARRTDLVASSRNNLPFNVRGTPTHGSPLCRPPNLFRA